ncbi:phytanoyl-CoA dioxygenase family protein [Jackrogersella minutella]|nr:phytanoyl-CoA dioxygenase family protein [Jackrogersella minutella]
MALDLDVSKAHLKEHGWVRIPSVLSQEDVSTTLARLWKAKQEAEAQGDATYLPFLDPNASNVRIFYLMEIDKIYRELISHPTAVELVKSVLGDDYLISNFTANIARPGARSMSLHSDQSLVVPGPWVDTWALNVIWPLTDTTRENGATLYIPGSNRWTRREEVPKNAPDLLIPFECCAGDMLVMDGRMWHTSGNNVTANEDRAQLFGYYTKPFIRQQVNWTAKLPKEIQDTLSEDLKDRLGLGVNGNISAVGDFRPISEQYPDYTIK